MLNYSGLYQNPISNTIILKIVWELNPMKNETLSDNAL